ncbi:MAG: glycosyltransferase [Magnetococcus sp. DMHC-6]
MKAERKISKVCYVLSYRDPKYIRTKTMVRALQSLEGIELMTAINRSRGWWRYLETLWQLVGIRFRDNPDCYVLGFRGHEIFWFVRWISYHKFLVFDSLVSPYAALSEERKYGRWGWLVSKALYRMEYAILHQADVVVTDTQRHVDFLCDTFSLSGEKVISVPVGADEGRWAQSCIGENDRFNVLFYGTFLPLHGVMTILDAALLLRDKPIYFTLIGGGGRHLSEFNSKMPATGLPHVRHIPWVPFDDLIECHIPQADLCLGGPFGHTPQANRVITGKTWQCLSMGKATVVGEILEPETGFVDRENCLLVPQGDATALAESLAWAEQNRELLPQIGQKGFLLYQTRYSVACLAERLQKIFSLC